MSINLELRSELRHWATSRDVPRGLRELLSDLAEEVPEFVREKVSVVYHPAQYVLVQMSGTEYMLARIKDDESDKETGFHYEFVAAGTYRQLNPIADNQNEYHRWNMNGGVNPETETGAGTHE